MTMQIGHTPVRWRPRAAPVSPVEMSPAVDKDALAPVSAYSRAPVRGLSWGISQTPHRNFSPPPSAGDPVATDVRAEEEVVEEEERPLHIAEIQRLPYCVRNASM